MNIDQLLNDLLNRMNYDIIRKLPRDNNPLTIAAQARNPRVWKNLHASSCLLGVELRHNCTLHF